MPIARSARPDKITIIFVRKVSSRYRGKLQTEIEDMHLPNPVIRSHYGNGFIKQYVRNHVLLRTEAATNNVNDYGVNKAVENLPKLREKHSAIPIRLDDAIMKTNAAWAASIRRQRHIGDFRGWAQPENYQAGFDRLLEDLRTGK